MTDHYEDAEDQKQRTLPNRKVIGFVMRYWLRRPGLLSGMVLFSLLSIAADMAIPLAAGRLVDAVAEGPQAANVAWGAWAVFVALYLVLSVVRNIANKFWNPLAALNMRDLTDEGFARVQSFSADWHADAFAGATVRRLSRAMWGYDLVSDAIVMWIGPALLVLIGLSVMMIVRWPMVGLFSLAIVALYIASNVILTAKYGRPLNQRSVALDSRIGGALADSVTGNATVRSFGAEARESARIGEITETWRGAVVRTWNRFTDLWLIQNMLLAVLQGGLTGLLLLLWSQGKATPGDVAFGITAFLVMSGYLRNIGENVRMLQKGLDDVEDVARFAEMAPQVADAPDAAPLAGQLGEVVFENATFRYKSVNEPLFRNFSLTIRPGERVALVGPTGSGKSSFVKLVQRLYDLDEGRILIDGQDIARVQQGSLRRAIAVVPQDPALFHRTIADNIAYARPEATADEVALAARRARAHEFIMRLPLGYQTLVGERGVKLSGGERQRVAIARAFLADAPILVFDEATSSLDVETERDVQAAMEELMVGRTTIVIAHRLSTVRNADRILVFDQGHIVEEGRHADLVKQGGAYARLHAVSEGAV
ncbi:MULTISPECIES: ABC transporter ATP-binding protein [unclassified Phenylobacterium]|uniref:ABC transporter ATP-binding protein n=1 Tax=unclassified Phenylobacterium TaxID=2640670 RepID=UPI0022B4BEAA|nr:ABC transporter ATP-binding protein [Phenylobacterium sp. NIBR 498073]MBS0490706.1 ABC transporter ATP-binding protein [Pseudomonadota bacterium]WGU41064.1 ABC transporter ATP-binding protein [Phenylobacterium sp. NIBR 498073]